MRFWYLLLAVLMISPVFAQTTYKVKRGERPPVNLQSTPESAYYKGVIKIKLNESLARQLDENPAFIDADGIVKFGISSIDQLNGQHGVDNFGLPFGSPAHIEKFTERHRAWGFHLWYKLYFDESIDVKSMVAAYRALGEVAFAEPEYRKVLVTQENPVFYTPEETADRSVAWTPDDPRYNEQWHYHNTGQQNGTADADIDLPEAWEITKGNPEVIVCIEDGGINYTHGDIAANMWSGTGYNFVNNSPNVTSHDHGTHVAGTVAAVSNNAVGVAGVAGGDGSGNGIRLMSCQVFTNGGSGGFENAPVWAADNGAAISQNSWQYTSPNSYDQSVLDAIDYFNVNGGGDALVDGGITIFAAGNNDSQSQYYPAFYSGTFSVAGLTNQDKKAWYSNFGDWVEVAAPGGETDNVAARGVLSTLPNNTYGFYQGTSMACPHVSGLAALIVSLAYGQFTPQQVGDIMKNTTDNVDAANPGFVGKLGTGRINAFAALSEARELMINVDNPLVFTALPGSSTTVNLNWVKNAENNDVMVATSLINIFGDPVQGQAYQTGEVIEGGGTIIYQGPESTFIHADLTSNTPYYYKAWSLNEVPEYSQGLAVSATTLKDPITSFPYHESFDNDNFPPVNWENRQLSGNATWDRQTSGTNPVCLPQSGDGMARFNSHIFDAGNSGILVSPPVQFGEEDYETSLWVYRDSELPSNTDKVELYINIAPNTGFATLLGTIHRSLELSPVETETGWHRYTFEIPATFHNKLAYLVFKGTSNLGNNVFVDDVHIEIPVNCFPPTDLTVNSYNSGAATISWTGVEPATAWDVEYGLQGFDPGSGTIIHVIDNLSVELTSLSQNTTYDVYVRGACATDDTSTWAGPVGFTTLCSAIAPWNESFEAMNNSFDCWQVLQNTADDGGLNGNNLVPAMEGSWFVCTPESFENNGADYIYTGSRSAAIENDAIGFNWLITGEIMMPASNQTDLLFRLKFLNDDAYPTRFHVNVLNNGAWSTLRSWTTAVDANNYQLPVYINMDAFTGQTIRLAFVYEANNGHNLAIDNISLIPATNYWTGNGNSNWSDVANWRLAVPQQTETADIHPAANQPVISGSIDILNINIHPSATLTLSPDAKVTVTNSLNNMDGGQLILKANEHGQASLIHHENGINTTVETFTTAAEGLHGWRLLSMPMGLDIEPEFLSQEDGMYKWDEVANDWIPAYLGDGTWNPLFTPVMYAGFSYLTGYNSQRVLSTNGVTGGLTYGLVLHNTGQSGNGWNLLGNPFTASIYYNSETPQFATIGKVWNSEEGSFNELYPGAIIPPMSGFAVEVLETTATYPFPAESRTHAAGYLPEAPQPSIALSVSETQNGTRQHAAININSLATEGYDSQFDAGFLKGFAPQLYSFAGASRLSVNTLPSVASGRLIRIGFVKNDATSYSLQVQSSQLYPGMVIGLHDIKTGTIQDLTTDNVYNFTAADGDDPNRFELFFGTVGVDENATPGDIICYTSGKTIYLKSTLPMNGEVIISSLSGKQLIRTKATGENLVTIDGARIAAGTYLVSLITDGGVVTKKVVIN
ncbi:MAG: S8 family serine peptidase [Lentimicrobium sp.]